MVNMFIVLLLSHLLTDFILQNDKLVKRKNSKRCKEQAGALLQHIFTFFIVSTLIFQIVLGLTYNIFWGLFVLSLFHGLLDCIKITVQAHLKQVAEISIFLSDQAVHLISILLFVQYYTRSNVWDTMFILISDIFSHKSIALYFNPLQKVGIILCLIIVITSVSNIFIRMSLSNIKFSLDTENNKSRDPKIGRYIGSVERILTAFAVIAGSYEVLIALYASKTAIRYHETKQGNFAEYFLLGTSISAVIGIVVGLMIRTVLM